MKPGLLVGLGPGHIVLGGAAQLLPQRGTAPQFSARICCGQMAGWTKMPLGRKVGLGPSDIVSPKRGQAPNFEPMSIVAKRLDRSTWHLAWR